MYFLQQDNVHLEQETKMSYLAKFKKLVLFSKSYMISIVLFTIRFFYVVNETWIFVLYLSFFHFAVVFIIIQSVKVSPSFFCKCISISSLFLFLIFKKIWGQGPLKIFLSTTKRLLCHPMDIPWFKPSLLCLFGVVLEAESFPQCQVFLMASNRISPRIDPYLSSSIFFCQILAASLSTLKKFVPTAWCSQDRVILMVLSSFLMQAIRAEHLLPHVSFCFFSVPQHNIVFLVCKFSHLSSRFLQLLLQFASCLLIRSVIS